MLIDIQSFADDALTSNQSLQHPSGFFPTGPLLAAPAARLPALRCIDTLQPYFPAPNAQAISVNDVGVTFDVADLRSRPQKIKYQSNQNEQKPDPFR